MKKLLRILLLSDLRPTISYPVRVLFFYSLVACALPVILYFNLRDKMVPAQAFEVAEKLLFYEVWVGITVGFVAFIYAFLVGSDYLRVKEFAKRIARGEFNYELKLSSFADREVVELYRELTKLRNSLVISQELLRRRPTK